MSLSVLIPMLVEHMGRFASRKGNDYEPAPLLTGALAPGKNWPFDGEDRC